MGNSGIAPELLFGVSVLSEALFIFLVRYGSIRRSRGLVFHCLLFAAAGFLTRMIEKYWNRELLLEWQKKEKGD